MPETFFNKNLNPHDVARILGTLAIGMNLISSDKHKHSWDDICSSVNLDPDLYRDDLPSNH